MPFLPEIDLEVINLLIKKEREERNNAQKQPFLQLPLPSPPTNPEFYKKPEEKEKNNEIIIDL